MGLCTSKQHVKDKPPATKRILVIGPADSGKSTFVLQLLRCSGYDAGETERRSCQRPIQLFVMQLIQETLQRCDRSKVSRLEPENIKYCRIILDHDMSSGVFPGILLEAMDHILASAVLEDRFAELRRDAHADYFVSRYRRILTIGYVASSEDLIHFRCTTEDIKVSFALLDSTELRFIEIPGTRFARRKWIQSLERIDHILFFASSVHYRDDSDEYEESVVFFETICNSRLFKDVRLSLVFTKTDELKRRTRSQGVYTSILTDLKFKYESVTDRDVRMFDVNVMSLPAVRTLIDQLLEG